ncbi:MAG TPA: oligopeptide/dipeptide ABC transporter ATP-binding protein [Oligoflexus sp.]|uniref:ABC transporter ATP-binding protein n=1 Tax=Oligoflexus sp. TaxID=1971216 RepID=UPI002D4ED6DF|nr:oligopeptide/dipeptide ABC transporter ATP-binding protein [Oligoflexus sp.]HYX33271.1 oligopeptide/dipeptide ABC transporter ATP-binding protein [Oligoflexus sp.]
MLLLEAQDLSKSFARHPAVKGLSLQLHAGEVLGVLGESGCGKSTLARLLTGLLKPDSGTVVYEGQKPEAMSRRQRARWIQMMFQDSSAALHPRLRVGAALLEVLRTVCGLDRHAALQELQTWLPKMQLPASILERFPHQLSGGQKQRICLLRALILKPKVLVCDEPVTALDRMTQARVLQLIQNLRQELGFAVLFISHDITTVRTLADRVAVMYAGQWMECGPAEEVLNRPRHPYTQYLLQSLPKLYREPTLKLIPDFQEASKLRPNEGCPLSERCPFSQASCKHTSVVPAPGHFSSCVRPGVF